VARELADHATGRGHKIIPIVIQRRVRTNGVRCK